jgi:hypothetical protein
MGDEKAFAATAETFEERAMNGKERKRVFLSILSTGSH